MCLAAHDWEFPRWTSFYGRDRNAARREHRVRWRLQRLPAGPQSGSQDSRRFRKPPYDPGRRDFPVPVLTLAFRRGPSQIRGEAQALTCIHPAYAGSPTTSSPLRRRPCLGSESEDRLGTAKCPEPLRCMPALPSCRRRHASPRRTLLPLHRSYGLMRQTAALLSPLTLPLAPGLCRLLSAPAAQRLFPTLSLPIYPYVSGPLLRWPSRCNFPFLPLRRWPSPRLNRVGASPNPQQLLPLGSKFRSCSHSLMFRPARLLATPVAPTLTPFDAGQPWLLHPRISQFVTSLRSGYANRPNREIGGKGTHTPQNRQPCRLLLKP